MKLATESFKNHKIRAEKLMIKFNDFGKAGTSSVLTVKSRPLFGLALVTRRPAFASLTVYL